MQTLDNTNNNNNNLLAKDIVQVLIAPDFLIKYNPSRKRVLQLIACGWSNASIAEDLNFSTKNIESITTLLIRLAKIHDINGHLNPRARLVAKCHHAKKLRYNPSQEPPNELLSEDQTATLLLVSAGLSNKTIGKILGISEKTVESRLNNLFLQFGVNAKANKVINPRLRLIAVANSRQNITAEAFDEVWQKTNNVDLEQVVNNPQELREGVLKLASNLVEEAPKHRDNAHKEQILAQQRNQQHTQLNPAHAQGLYNRLNPNPQTKQQPQQ
ncbi:MAG: helix-turn-helix transcriptional regulator [Candidatus Melainabacteria bacterium]|nr:helix-turn-helix transcriptional regulator [Candidatus Melainabacteria bacterium]